MSYEIQTKPISRPAIWTGRVISALPVLLMVGGGIPALLNPASAADGFRQFGYPEQYLRGIIATEIICAVIYAIPRTSVLGAILLTGYLGGAVATHVRVRDPMFVIAITVGVLVWLGLYLRDRRVRELIPLRS